MYKRRFTYEQCRKLRGEIGPRWADVINNSEVEIFDCEKIYVCRYDIFGKPRYTGHSTQEYTITFGSKADYSKFLMKYL